MHEWSIMERFCHTVDDAAAQTELLDTIHGSGAFRAFRRSLDRLDLREQWHAFRQARLEQIARDWLEANHVPWESVRSAPRHNKALEWASNGPVQLTLVAG